MGELAATIVIGLFYVLAFFTTWAAVELAYAIVSGVQSRRRLRAWSRKR